MRKIYFILFGFLLSSGLMAQPGPNFKIQNLKSAYNRSFAKKIQAVFENMNNSANFDFMALVQEQINLKSAVIKQKLDSIVTQKYDTLRSAWRPDYNEQFTYDIKGQTVSEIYNSWYAPLNKLVPDSKTTYDYNSGGTISAYHSFSWDTVSSVPQWVEKYKTLYTYNANNQVTEMINYTWDSNTKTLQLASKTTNTYNAGGKVLVQTMYTWKATPAPGSWELATKTENTYDVSNNLIKAETSYNMGGTNWLLYNKYEYTYSQGKVTQEIYSSLDYLTMSLVNSSKEVYSYNGTGDQTLVINSKWDKNLSTWVNDWKDEYTYDSNHHQLTYKEYEWDQGSSSWKPYQMEENTFDSNGNLTSTIQSDGDASGNWVKSSKMDVTYNNSYNTSDLLFPYIYRGDVSSYFTKMITGYSDYLWKNNNWFNDTKTAFYYSSTNITSAEIIGASAIMVYPNPAKDYLNVYSDSNQSYDVSLFNLVGNLVLEKQFIKQITLSVGNLPSGIYLVRVKSSENAKDFIQRIVIK